MKQFNLLFDDVFPFAEQRLAVGVLLVEDAPDLFIDDLVRFL